MITASSALADAAITFSCCAYNPTSDTPVPGGFANSSGTFYSVQFSTAGTYDYQCPVYGVAQSGGTMRGQIVVLPIGPVGTADALDVDASGKADALTDDTLIIRYLRQLTGMSLTKGALGGTAQRADPAEIRTYLVQRRVLLDIDGNGTTAAMSDGRLIIHYLFGLCGSALIAGAADPAGSRMTPTEIEAYLLSLMPPWRVSRSSKANESLGYMVKAFR